MSLGALQMYIDDDDDNPPTTKQLAVISIQLNIVTCPTYKEKFIRHITHCYFMHRLYFPLSLSHCRLKHLKTVEKEVVFCIKR